VGFFDFVKKAVKAVGGVVGKVVSTVGNVVSSVPGLGVVGKVASTVGGALTSITGNKVSASNAVAEGSGTSSNTGFFTKLWNKMKGVVSTAVTGTQQALGESMEGVDTGAKKVGMMKRVLSLWFIWGPVLLFLVWKRRAIARMFR